MLMILATCIVLVATIVVLSLNINNQSENERSTADLAIKYSIIVASSLVLIYILYNTAFEYLLNTSPFLNQLNDEMVANTVLNTPTGSSIRSSNSTIRS